MPDTFHLFYIHGFNSSPQSAKARVLGDAVQGHARIRYHVPALPYDPQQAIAILRQAIETCLPEQVGLVGSSMGGFYGTCMAEQYDLPLVLINPAVRPYELLKDYLGENHNIYTGEKYIFTEEHIRQLQALDVDPITRPERYLLLTQTGDEVLDYRQAVARYAGCRQIVLEGGDHSFSRFPDFLPQLIEFCRL